ncbi:MAG TPA: DNA topoisomerase III, partial [Pseudomonas sp.]|nr:DNA topoisomerase III [Pseudomonas sp.]
MCWVWLVLRLLFKRNFLIKQGKEIHATAVGRSLILSLPEMMARPDMTAHWESQLEAIAEKRMSYNQFMMPML